MTETFPRTRGGDPNGAVFMREADCGNQDCVQQGAMSLDNYTQRFLGNLILCLPHKLEIQLLQNP